MGRRAGGRQTSRGGGAEADQGEVRWRIQRGFPQGARTWMRIPKRMRKVLDLRGMQVSDTRDTTLQKFAPKELSKKLMLAVLPHLQREPSGHQHTGSAPLL